MVRLFRVWEVRENLYSSAGIWAAGEEVRQLCSSSVNIPAHAHTHTHAHTLTYSRTADLASVRMDVGNAVPATLLQVPACLRLTLKPPACLELIPIRLDSASLYQR